jgi:enoyl-CoA hydratase
MDAMGIRAAIRAGTEMQAMGAMTEGARAHLQAIRKEGLTKALTDRDARYGDYRTKQPSEDDHVG